MRAIRTMLGKSTSGMVVLAGIENPTAITFELSGADNSFPNSKTRDNGTITHFSSGLMWQQDTARDPNGNFDTMTWQQALAYCEGLSLEEVTATGDCRLSKN